MDVLSSLVLLQLAAWLVMTFHPRFRWPRELLLGRSSQRGPADVVVFVPARDEEEVLERSLGSLAKQTRSARAIVVVDDHSTDGTANVIRGVAERSEVPILRLPARPLPAGWAGKMNALETALRWVSRDTAGEDSSAVAGPPPRWLLLTDADIEHPSHSIASLIAQAESDDRQLVSIMARLRARTGWERLIIPPFVAFFQLLYPFRSIGRAQSRVAAAAGGCVLVERQALVDAGGFGTIAHELIDDVALGRTLKSRGARIWLGFDPEVRSIRPYVGLQPLWDMVARSAFVQLKTSWTLLWLVMAALGVFFVSPPWVAAIAGLRAANSGSTLALTTALASVAVLGLQWLFLAPSVRHHRCPWPYAATLSISSLLYAMMTLSSALRHRRGTSSSWKNRDYSADADGASAQNVQSTG